MAYLVQCNRMLQCSINAMHILEEHMALYHCLTLSVRKAREEMGRSSIHYGLSPSNGSHWKVCQWRDWNLYLVHSSSKHIRSMDPQMTAHLNMVRLFVLYGQISRFHGKHRYHVYCHYKNNRIFYDKNKYNIYINIHIFILSILIFFPKHYL
jgi:hypothetical protein